MYPLAISAPDIDNIAMSLYNGTHSPMLSLRSVTLWVEDWLASGIRASPIPFTATKRSPTAVSTSEVPSQRGTDIGLNKRLLTFRRACNEKIHKFHCVKHCTILVTSALGTGHVYVYLYTSLHKYKCAHIQSIEQCPPIAYCLLQGGLTYSLWQGSKLQCFVHSTALQTSHNVTRILEPMAANLCDFCDLIGAGWRQLQQMADRGAHQLYQAICLIWLHTTRLNFTQGTENSTWQVALQLQTRQGMDHYFVVCYTPSRQLPSTLLYRKYKT